MAIELENSQNRADLLRMTADIVAAFISYNTIPVHDLPNVLKLVHSALSSLRHTSADPSEERQKPAVSIKKSINDDYLVCLEDGKRLKILKRYLRTKYDLSPDEYWKKWDLAPDYPMVAANYSKQRSNFAKTIGLGRRAKS